MTATDNTVQPKLREFVYTCFMIKEEACKHKYQW